MPQVELICLANSRKHGGRCVAGLCVDGSGWIRPIRSSPDGTLFLHDYTLNDGTETELLDIVRVGLRARRSAPHQPENWIIDSTTWLLHSRPMGINLAHVLRNAISRGPELLRGFSDRVPIASFQQQPAATSLALIAPDRIELYQKTSFSGRPQARGRFALGLGQHTTVYDLVITDPFWEGVILRQQTRQTLQQSKIKFLVTVSLSEPFGADCYKLIAAVIRLPVHLAAVL